MSRHRLILSFSGLLPLVFIAFEFSAKTSCAETAQPQNNDQVTLDGKTYFKKNNAVYWKYPNSDSSYMLPDSKGEVDSLITYQGKLYMLEGVHKPWYQHLFESSGNVYLFENSGWKAADYSDKQVLADKTDLVTLSKTGQLWIYNGKMSDPEHHSYTYYTKIGNTNFPMTTHNDVQASSFHDTKIKNVKSISLKKQDDGEDHIMVEMEKGQVVSLDELKAANFSVTAVQELRKLSGRGPAIVSVNDNMALKQELGQNQNSNQSREEGKTVKQSGSLSTVSAPTQ